MLDSEDPARKIRETARVITPPCPLPVSGSSMLIFKPAMAARVAAAFRAFSDKLLMELLELRNPSPRPDPGVRGLLPEGSSLNRVVGFKLSAGRAVLFVVFCCTFFSVPFVSKVG